MKREGKPNSADRDARRVIESEKIECENVGEADREDRMSKEEEKRDL